MDIVVKTLRDSIIRFSMQVKHEGVKNLTIKNIRLVKCTLVTNVLCLDRRTAPTATKRYEFRLADSNIARPFSICNSYHACLRNLSIDCCYDDPFTGIYAILSRYHRQASDIKSTSIIF